MSPLVKEKWVNKSSLKDIYVLLPKTPLLYYQILHYTHSAQPSTEQQKSFQQHKYSHQTHIFLI